MRGTTVWALVFAALTTILAGQIRAEERAEPMTHGELAKRVCFISGLAESMKPPITQGAAINTLTQKGWAPLNGWRVDAYATREDFYVVMAKYMGLRLEGPADQAKSYYQALATEGLFVDLGAADAAPDLDAAPPRLGDAAIEVNRIALMVKGPVEFRRNSNDAWAPLKTYDVISEGMEIRTGEKGEVSLSYAAGCAQQISENTLIRLRKLSLDSGAINAVVEIDHGKAFTMVKPQAEGSRFEIQTRMGKLDVDTREGCEFESIIVRSEPIALNEADARAVGLAVLAPIQEDSAQFTGFRGRATGFHSGGKKEFLKPGECLYFLAAGLRTIRADSFDFGRIAGLINRFERFTHEFLLTESEIRAFLANIASGGTCEIHVTPIGR